MDLKGFGKFDWHSLKKYFSPKAMDDVNIFLEKLPHNTSKTMLVVVGIVWAFAAAMGLFTTVKMQEFAEKTLEKEEKQALLPVVPKLRDTPVNSRDVQLFVDEIRETYKGLEIKGNSSNIMISAKSTSMFGQFREAIGHVQNGGAGWRVSVDKMCVGKDCIKYPLSASLKINKVSVENAVSK